MARTVQYLFAGNGRFTFAIVVLLVGGWYFITGYFGEARLGWWRGWFEALFILLPLTLTVAAAALLLVRRRRAVRDHATLPLRNGESWPAWVWTRRFERIAVTHPDLRPQYRWMADQLRRCDPHRELTDDDVGRWISRRWNAIGVPIFVLAAVCC